MSKEMVPPDDGKAREAGAAVSGTGTRAHARPYGYIGEFDSARAVYEAAKKMRDAGYKKWDVHSPYPIHGMDEAMGLGKSILSWLVFFGGATGFFTAVVLAGFTQISLYPTIVQSKPANLNTIPAFFPIMFELTVLFSAFTVLFGILVLNQLPRFNHPLFNSKRFLRFSDDGFFISVEVGDPLYSTEGTPEFLESIGATAVELVEHDDD
ncbi:MAG: DUF3341 domain-containing protein [Verrucomicrobiota bacterium]